jgi:hypothetical protein
MVEILGGNLRNFFDRVDREVKNADITYTGELYEVWEVSDELFERMCNMTEEQFYDIAENDEAWWRQSSGSNMGTPDTKVHINGHELLGWYSPWDDDDPDDEFEIYSSKLTSYLCDVCGASKPRNVCALAMDLAKYNNITMGELFTKCEG